MQLDAQTQAQHRARYEALRSRAQGRASGSVARVAPAPVPEDRIAWRQTIPGGWYGDARLRRGERLRIVNTHATPGVSVLLWNADDPSERYNAGDTVKLQWTARLRSGHVLFSDMGRVLASIVEDTSGEHDTLLGGSTPASNARRHPGASLRNSRDNFRLVAGKHGLGVRDLPGCITFFAPVRTGADGRFAWESAAAASPGAYVELRAEMNLLVAVSNCPHPLAPGPDLAPQPVELVLWHGPAPLPDDPCRTATEEAVRGFQNTDLLFRS